MFKLRQYSHSLQSFTPKSLMPLPQTAHQKINAYLSKALKGGGKRGWNVITKISASFFQALTNFIKERTVPLRTRCTTPVLLSWNCNLRTFNLKRKLRSSQVGKYSVLFTLQNVLSASTRLSFIVQRLLLKTHPCPD